MATLQIDDNVAAALQAQARARGLSVETYLRAVTGVEQAEGQSLAQAVVDFDAALDELFAADTRPLPDAPLSYSREDIYLDHD